MRGFRFVVIVQAALLLGATLFAAPGGDGSTIRIWFSHIEPENLAMVAIAEEFTSLTGIEVEVIGRRSIFDAPRDLANNAELDDRPDIILMQAPDIGNMVASGLIVPLKIDDDLRKRYLDATFEAFTYNNKCYGIGYSLDTSGLIYNRDLISESELPETWDDFFQDR
jgi:Maltose-binding periplasmic proteins/domains